MISKHHNSDKNLRQFCLTFQVECSHILVKSVKPKVKD